MTELHALEEFSAQEGWPARTGPLRTLAELGNVPAGTTPRWLNEPFHEIDGGRVGYKCRTNGGLGSDALLDLAALVVEGYHVYILPRGKYVRITILDPEGTN